jgi:hypothetical protein
MTLFSRKINYFTLFFVILILVLNSYTVVGPLAYFLLPLIILPLLDRFRLLSFDSFFLLLALVFISLVGVFSSFLNNIGQFVHFKVAISIAIYLLFSYAIFLIFNRKGFDFNDLVLLILLVAVVNSSVIILQVLYPDFRSIIEGFLVPSGNIDWTEGFRYRGLASGGGASLSVLIPVAIVLALHLYSEKIIGILVLFLFISILLVSLFFIGRTGFLLLPIVFASFVFFNLQKYIFKVFLFILIMIIFLLFFGEAIKDFVIEQYGVGFYNYSFGFFLGGVDGIKDEGTVGIIVEFLQVVPSTFPEVLIGYGFYGGSHFEPWTDSGYSRMFLSVGYFFGVAFYLSFFLIFRNIILTRKFLFLTIGVALLVAEFKEPLLFTGYASRVYVLLLGYALFEYVYLKRMRSISTKNIVTDRVERFA